MCLVSSNITLPDTMRLALKYEFTLLYMSQGCTRITILPMINPPACELVPRILRR
jgi:hypothetical protein